MSFAQLLADRLVKHQLYRTAGYWDMKAGSYTGLARSNWPSNRYNEQVHATQMQVVERVLGDVRGRRILDVGCGTGRLSQYLCARGALVTGWDFSERALGAARIESERRGLRVRYEQIDVTADLPKHRTEPFDTIVSLGCLTLACSSPASFERALANLVLRLAPRGRLLFIEPIHASRALSRLLRMDRREWRVRCERASLVLRQSGSILFAPARFMLAFRDVPECVVRPVFAWGEGMLARVPASHVLADYHWLLFERSAAPARSQAVVESWTSS